MNFSKWVYSIFVFVMLQSKGPSNIKLDLLLSKCGNQQSTVVYLCTYVGVIIKISDFFSSLFFFFALDSDFIVAESDVDNCPLLKPEKADVAGRQSQWSCNFQSRNRIVFFLLHPKLKLTYADLWTLSLAFRAPRLEIFKEKISSVFGTLHNRI